MPRKFCLTPSMYVMSCRLVDPTLSWGLLVEAAGWFSDTRMCSVTRGYAKCTKAQNARRRENKKNISWEGNGGLGPIVDCRGREDLILQTGAISSKGTSD